MEKVQEIQCGQDFTAPLLESLFSRTLMESPSVAEQRATFNDGNKFASHECEIHGQLQFFTVQTLPVLQQSIDALTAKT